MRLQKGLKRHMPDGREVSALWGGNINPDGSLKKKKRFVTKDQVQARRKENKATRKENSEKVRTLFIKRRAAAEETGKWRGPRKFEPWMLSVAERVLSGNCEHEEAQVKPTLGVFVL